MYGLVVEVAIADSRGDAAEKMLEEMVVPMAKALPGFVSGYWLQSDDGLTGTSMVIFDSENAARTAVTAVKPPEGSGVTLRRAEAMRVAASA